MLVIWASIIKHSRSAFVASRVLFSFFHSLIHFLLFCFSFIYLWIYASVLATFLIRHLCFVLFFFHFSLLLSFHLPWDSLDRFTCMLSWNSDQKRKSLACVRERQCVCKQASANEGCCVAQKLYRESIPERHASFSEHMGTLWTIHE